jgi:hypothetical protein
MMLDAAVMVQKLRAAAFGQRTQVRDLIGPAADIEQRQTVGPPWRLSVFRLNIRLDRRQFGA